MKGQRDITLYTLAGLMIAIMFAAPLTIHRPLVRVAVVVIARLVGCACVLVLAGRPIR